MNHPSIPAAIGAIPVNHRITRRKPMPLLTASLTIPVIATAFAIPAAALVIEQPRSADMYAVLGAILASLIALIEARYKGRDLGPAMTQFLACAIAGSVAPKLAFLGLLQWGFVTTENPLVRAWEAWAAAGFMLGMNGWWLIHKATAFIKSIFPKGKR
jgi:hypothetical protein